jgi:hypothetical protein
MAAITALSGLKKYFQKKESANVSNIIFNMHKFTCAMLLCCSALTTGKQYFGSNIHCMTDHFAVNMAVFESWCFMSGTFSIPHYRHNNYSQSHAHAYPGVSTGDHGSGGSHKGVMYHNYYQWVNLLLVLQACVAYIPWAWWKSAEGNRISKLTASINKDPLTEVPLEDQVNGLGNFFIRHPKWFDSCALKLLVCQGLCLLFSICQMYFMDIVLSHQFLHIGNHIQNWEQLNTALDTIFPLVVMCEMSFFGNSGEVQNASGVCNLPINIINEKIYLIIWVWFLVMIIATVLVMLGQLCLLVAPYLRYVLLHKTIKSKPPVHHIKRLIRRCSYGDYILLNFLAKNLDSSQFDALVSKICDSDAMFMSRHNSHEIANLETSYSSPSDNNNYGSGRRLTSKEV